MKTSEARSLPGALVDYTDPETDLAGALHEVSNALTVVLGWLDAAQEKLPAGPAREAVEVARTHARLGHHVARRAIGAEVGSEPTARTARWLAQSAVVGVTQEAQRRRIRIATNEQGASRVLVYDVGPVLQVLLNLLLNAIAFTPEGGSVTLALRHEVTSVVFTVSDEGPGIEPERARSVLSDAASTRSGGAGVGLRYSSALARSHGGELALERAGPGASFALRWPVDEAPSSARHPPVVAPVLRGARILVVEDDLAVCSLIEVALEARGASIVTAQTATAFTRAASSAGPFDAALVDLSPIAEDVEGALAALRRSSPEVAVILISGFASGVPAELEQQVSAWVRKPFEMGEVVDVLTGVIAARSKPTA